MLFSISWALMISGRYKQGVTQDIHWTHPN